VDKWKRIVLIVRIVASLVLAGVLAFVGYQLLDFWRPRLSSSPEAVTQEYFQALGEGNYERAYQLTNPNSLTSLYGRRASMADVFQSYRLVTGENPKPFTSIHVTRLGRKPGIEYMQVELISPATIKVRVLVEVTQLDGVWRITHPFGLAP